MTNIIGCDVSHYESPIDFVKMKSAGAKFTFIKSGQWDFLDYDFHKLWFAAKGILPRGSYFFYDKRGTPQAQADLWIESMQGDYGELPLVADFEGVFYGGNDIANFKIFLERTKELVPNKEIIIYTGYYFWLDDSGYTPAHAEYFKQFPLWIAAYGTSAPKIPAPWTDWLFWQYDDKGSGAIWGTGGGSVDLNYFNGDEFIFITRFNITLPDPPVDGEIKLLEAQVYYPGAIEKTFEVTTPHGNVVFHLTELETAKVKNFFVSPSPASRTYVPTFLKNNFLHFAINCGGWTSPPLVPTGYNSSEGQPYGQFGNEETIYISKNNVFSLARPSELWNAFSFQNRLIKDGVIPVINKAITDVRARTAIGYNQTQTRVYLFTCDGGDQYSTDGLNFQEVAAILLKLGCYQAFMLDGGGSTAKVVDDNGIVKVIGKTSGEDFITGYEYPLRRVLNVFGVVMDDGIITPPTGDKMYKVLVSIKDRPIASMYSTGATVRAAGYQFDSTVTVTGTNILKPSDFGVTFVQLPSGSWLPLKYKGVEYVTVTTIVPPDGKVLTNVIKVFNDGSIDVVPA